MVLFHIAVCNISRIHKTILVFTKAWQDNNVSNFASQVLKTNLKELNSLLSWIMLVQFLSFSGCYMTWISLFYVNFVYQALQNMHYRPFVVSRYRSLSFRMSGD